MNAADVLAEQIPGADMTVKAAAQVLVAALLAHGEQGQGVYVEVDGTMWKATWVEKSINGAKAWVNLDRLSVEARDTERSYDEAATRDLARSLLDEPAAEAGDTDAD